MRDRGQDGKVIVRRVATGKPIGPPITPGGRTVYGFFDPTDPTRLFTVGDDGTVSKWDLHDPGHPTPVGDRFTFPVAPNDIPVGVISPDGRLLAAGGFNARRTEVWDVASHRLLYELPGVPGFFSPDSATLTTTLPDRVVLWDAATGQQSGDPLTGFSVAAPATVFSPDGRLLAAGDLADNTIRVFDLTTRQPIGEQLALHAAFAFPHEFLPDGRLVTTGANEAAVWHIGAPVLPLETVLRGHIGGAPGMFSGAVGQFAPDGAEAITVGGTDHRVLAWNPATDAPRGELLDGRIATGYLVAFSPDAKTIAAGGLDGTFTLWDRSSDRQLAHVDTGQTGSLAVAWDPRRPILATSDADSSKLWDVTNPGHPVRKRLGARTTPAGLLFFSPDGRLLVVDTVGTATLTIIDVATGHTQRVLHESGTAIPQVSFTPDSTTLGVAMGESNNTGRVVFWDTTTWHRRATLTLPYLPGGLAFTDRGARFATSSFFEPALPGTTGRVDVWDTATLQPVGEPLAVPTTDTFLVVANAHGTKIAVGSNDTGVASVLDVDPRAWQRTACRIAGRNLTRAEWAQYIPGQPYHATCPQWPTGR